MSIFDYPVEPYDGTAMNLRVFVPDCEWSSAVEGFLRFYGKFLREKPLPPALEQKRLADQYEAKIVEALTSSGMPTELWVPAFSPNEYEEFTFAYWSNLRSMSIDNNHCCDMEFISSLIAPKFFSDVLRFFNGIGCEILKFDAAVFDMVHEVEHSEPFKIILRQDGIYEFHNPWSIAGDPEEAARIKAECEQRAANGGTLYEESYGYS